MESMMGDMGGMVMGAAQRKRNAMMNVNASHQLMQWFQVDLNGTNDDDLGKLPISEISKYSANISNEFHSYQHCSYSIITCLSYLSVKPLGIFFKNCSLF